MLLRPHSQWMTVLWAPQPARPIKMWLSYLYITKTLQWLIVYVVVGLSSIVMGSNHQHK